MTKQRDLSLDIAKAICIILMVAGHSGCPEYLNRFIYMFHMPCFFYISGRLLSDKYVSDLKTGLFRKAKGSYWPFIKWQLIFLLLHNVFAWLHIYSESYSVHDTIVKGIRILTMTGGEQLLGGFWFLISLFWASVLTLLYLSVLNKAKKLNLIFISGGVILLLIFAGFEHLIPIDIPSQFREQTIMATAFYMTGYLSKRVDFPQIKHSWLSIFLLAIPAITAAFVSMSMDSCRGISAFPYYIIALGGTLGIVQLSKLLADSLVSKSLSYIGSKTLYILTFHFLSFKSVSFIYIKCSGAEIARLSEFPGLADAPSWLWAIYVIAGVGLPLLLVWGYDKVFHSVGSKRSSGIGN